MRNSNRFGIFTALAIAILSSAAFWDGEGSSVNASLLLADESGATAQPASEPLVITMASPSDRKARRSAFLASVTRQLEHPALARGPENHNAAMLMASDR